VPLHSRHGFNSKEVILILAFICGVLAALAYSAYQKVRVASQDKAVLCPIRQLAAAADQYYLENGVSTVRYEDLVGVTNYIKAVTPVAGETYPAVYMRGMTITVPGVAGVRTLTYAP
jgi:type IV pilus assembly protein PilA